jgi:hypothetical protein
MATTQSQVEVPAAHSSGQFSDKPTQQTSDAWRLTRRMVHRKWWWLTGTEAGSRSVLDIAFRKYDGPAGLHFRKAPTGDVWTMYRRNIFDGPVEQQFYKVIDGIAGKFADRGIFRVTGHAPEIDCDLTILVSHWLTEGRPVGKHQPFRASNEKLADKLTQVGVEFGRGSAKCFYDGDQNIPEQQGLLLDAPFLSAAKELDKVQNTGHGPIDCMAVYAEDVRVEPLDFNVLDDTEFPLKTDHWLCEGLWGVKLPHKHRANR